jgi:hypothetical protein
VSECVGNKYHSHFKRGDSFSETKSTKTHMTVSAVRTEVTVTNQGEAKGQDKYYA